MGTLTLVVDETQPVSLLIHREAVGKQMLASRVKLRSHLAVVQSPYRHKLIKHRFLCERGSK